MTVIRSTISFQEKNWNKVKGVKNRSKLVNDALENYFRMKNFLKEKEEEFILNEFKHYEETGESYTFDETFN